MAANLILMAGLPASGKSTFASYAAKELGLPVIEKDRIKEYLFDTVGFRTYEEKTKLDIAASDIMMYTAACILERGGSVILDNNFEDRNLPHLRELVASNPCNVVTVRFAGDIRAIYGRFLARDRDPERHPGHVITTCWPQDGKNTIDYPVITLEEFEAKFRRRGTFGFGMGTVIEVDATDPAALSYPDILSQLRRTLV